MKRDTKEVFDRCMELVNKHEDEKVALCVQEILDNAYTEGIGPWEHLAGIIRAKETAVKAWDVTTKYLRYLKVDDGGWE